MTDVPDARLLEQFARNGSEEAFAALVQRHIALVHSVAPKDVSIIIGTDPDFNPKGMNLTVVSATDDQGRELWHPFGVPCARQYSIEFANVHDDIKSLTMTLALHKSRFVEFTLKPEKAGDATTPP